jgi:hypothetical protein
VANKQLRSRIVEVTEKELEQCDNDAFQDAQIQNVQDTVEDVVGTSIK